MMRDAVIAGRVLRRDGLSAQAAVDQPRFEVASVTPNTSGAIAQSSRIANCSVTATNMQLRALIVAAHGVDPD